MTSYVAIDIETTGLDPVTCQVLELAMVVETDWASPVDSLPRLHVRVDHPLIIGSPRALVMNQELLAELAKSEKKRAIRTVDPGSVPLLVRQFLNKHFEPGRSVNAAGKNVASFDLPFLAKLVGWPSDRFRHRVIDVGNLWWVPEVDDALPDMTACVGRSGVTGDWQQHSALHDCYLTIESIRLRFPVGSAAVAAAVNPEGEGDGASK